MGELASFNHFSSLSPVIRVKEISPFPFVLELVPNDASLIYDLQKLEENNIDLGTNLLWYRVPSSGAVVFFRWQEAPKGYILKEDAFLDSGESYINTEDLFLFEYDVDGSGQAIEIDEDDEILNKVVIMVPCTHSESQGFYDGLVLPEGRELLRELFTEAMRGIEHLAVDDNGGTSGTRYPMDSEGGVDMSAEEGWQWLQNLGGGAISDEEDDLASLLLKTPTRRARASLPEGGEYDSSSGEEGGVEFRVHIHGRLRNRSSLNDLTPMGRLLSMPTVEQPGSP